MTEEGWHGSIRCSFIFTNINLLVLTKLLQQTVAWQLLSHLSSWGLLPRLQSAYQVRHSTPVPKILSDILLAIDSGDLSALVLLDLSATFDRLTIRSSFGIWKLHTNLTKRCSTTFKTYLVGCCMSQKVPRGSLLGPILLSSYITALLSLTCSWSTLPCILGRCTDVVPVIRSCQWSF